RHRALGASHAPAARAAPRLGLARDGPRAEPRRARGAGPGPRLGDLGGGVLPGRPPARAGDRRGERGLWAPPPARHRLRAVGRRRGRRAGRALRADREPGGTRRRARRLQPAGARLPQAALQPARGEPVKRALVPLAPGFEEIEAITIIDVLRRAGVTVDVAGTEPGPITGSHGITVTPDRSLAGIDADPYDLVALPGGMPGTLNLREHADVRRVVRELAERGRYTTAICAAPTVLKAAGVAEGRAVTSHPSVAAELDGSIYRIDAVVRDGPVITSRGAGTA